MNKISESTASILQDAFLESFVNRVIIHINRELTQFVKRIIDALEELNEKMKSFAIDTLVKEDFEVLEYKIQQETTAAKSRIYESLNQAIIQQKEFAKVVDFLTGMISSALESHKKVTLEQKAPIITDEIVKTQYGNEIQMLLQQVKKQLETVTKENLELKEANQQLMKKLEEMAKSQKVNKEKIKDLESEIRKRDEKIKQLMASLMKYKSEIERLGPQEKVIDHEKEELEKAINLLKAEYTLEVKKNISLSNKIEELNTIILELRNRNAELENKLKELKEKNKKIVTELENVRDVLLKLQKEKQMMEREAAIYIRKATEYDKLIMQIHILDELMKSNPQYSAIRILSEKISQGVFKIPAEELGYRMGDVSLAAWLTNFFGHLKDQGIIDFEIESTKGFPRGWIVITDKGKKLFVELRNKIFSGNV
ncbi:MAG: hypothetical protein ABGF52_09470 [Candidatus Asgardarchaeum sp.]